MLLTKNCHFQQRWNGTFLKAQCQSSVRKTKTEVRLVRTPDISNPDIESPRERIRTYGTRTVIVLEGSGCIVAIVARLARITFSYCLAFNHSELGFRFGSCKRAQNTAAETVTPKGNVIQKLYSDYSGTICGVS